MNGKPATLALASMPETPFYTIGQALHRAITLFPNEAALDSLIRMLSALVSGHVTATLVPRSRSGARGEPINPFEIAPEDWIPLLHQASRGGPPLKGMIVDFDDSVGLYPFSYQVGNQTVTGYHQGEIILPREAFDCALAKAAAPALRAAHATQATYDEAVAHLEPLILERRRPTKGDCMALLKNAHIVVTEAAFDRHVWPRLCKIAPELSPQGPRLTSRAA
jgi:hypothetical protein